MYIMRIKLPFMKRHEKERKRKVKHTWGENIRQYTYLTNASYADYSSNSHRSIKKNGPVLNGKILDNFIMEDS